MAQVLHAGAKTTHAVRAEIQRSQASIAALSKRYGINPKTVCKWNKRQSVEDAPMGPKNPRSTVSLSKKKPHALPCFVIPYCFWMIVFTPCNRRSRISGALR